MSRRVSSIVMVSGIRNMLMRCASLFELSNMVNIVDQLAGNI